MVKINLIIEKGEDGKLWGRVNFRNNLIVDLAPTVEMLEKKMRKLIKDFHDVDVTFNHFIRCFGFF